MCNSPPSHEGSSTSRAEKDYLVKRRLWHLVKTAFAPFLHKRSTSRGRTLLYGATMFIAGIIYILLLYSGSIQLPNILAVSSWTQTDWSAGVGSSTTDQYSASSGVTTSTAGQHTLTQTSGWAADYTSWSKRKAVTVTNSGTEQTNYQVKLTVTYDADMQTDFDDIRFTNGAGTAIDFWQQSKTDSTSAIYWVDIATLTGTGNTTIYMYYGNSAASSASSGLNTFSFFDDFDDNSFDTGKWTEADPSSKISEATGKLKFYYGSGSGAWNAGVYSVSSFARSDLAVEYDLQWTSDYSPYDAFMFGWKDDGSGVSYTNLVYGYYSPGSGTCTTNCSATGYEDGSNRSGTYYWTKDTNYLIRLRMRSSGGAYYEKSTDGGATFTTDYTSTYSTESNLHIAWMLYSGDYLIDNVRVRKWLATEPTSVFASEENQYPSSGTLVSAIFDASTGHDWGVVSFTTTTPSGTSVVVKVRSSNASDMTGATDWASCSSITTGSQASTGSCVTNNHRYVQYQNTLSGDTSNTPTFSDITINMTPSDTTAPTTNASSLALKASSSGSSISSGAYTNSATPYLTFTAGADNDGGSGLKGYCAYLGTDSSADPATSKGMLGTSPVSVSGSTCQFIVSSTPLDLSTSGYIGTALTSSSSPYYLLLKAIDNGNNVFQGSAASFSFLYDGTSPTNVTYLSTPSTTYSNVNEMVFSWPTSGASASSDGHSGLLGYQYQLNSSSGTWKGTTASGACGLDYIPIATGSHTLTTAEDGDDITVGNNVVYLRTIDNVCNTSSGSTIRTGNLEYGGEAPSFALSCSNTAGVVVTPTTNTNNSFAFAWDEATPSNSNTITNYYYMINTSPPSALSTITSNSTTYIDVDTATSVSARSFTGLVKGSNTVYVVAQDSADNYSSSTCIKGTFTLNSDYPDPPKNVTVSDASIKSSSLWRASLAWSTPDYAGTGTLTYTVSRSEDASTWTAVTTTTGTAYVDTVPSSKRYYFKVCVADTSSQSIATPSCANAVTTIPKGSYTSAPDLSSGPTASAITTKKSTIKWTTSRTADSKVSYGTSSGSYFSEEPSNSSQVTDHTINLTNLSPGTTYYYKTKWTDEDGNTGISTEKSFATDSAPSIVDPKVISLGLDTITASFTSKGSSKVKIYYGTSTSFGGVKEFSTSTSETQYTTTIDSLEDGTKYYYKINSFDSEGSEYEGNTLTFETLPRPKISTVRFEEVTGTAQPAVIVSWQTNTETSSIITYYPQGQPLQAKDEVSVTLIKGAHKMLLKSLNPQVVYAAQVKGKDRAGNEALSDVQTFTTSTDTRPPQIMNLKVEGSSELPGSGSSGGIEDAKSQLVVSWDTDEPSTSQVEFGEGTGTAYSQKSQEDSNFTTNHIIIISNLTPSKVYHLRALSKDKARNVGQSVDTVTITPKSSRSALELVIGNLGDVFGILAE